MVMVVCAFNIKELKNQDAVVRIELAENLIVVYKWNVGDSSTNSILFSNVVFFPANTYHIFH